MKEKTRKIIAFYLMISPWFIVFILLSLIPLLYGLYLSFTNYYGFNMNNLKFMGWHNYKLVFTDSDALHAMGRTLKITAIGVPLGTAIAFLLALLLNRKLRGGGIYRTIFYLPSVVPAISTVLMFKFIFAGNDGILNSIFTSLHIPTINWLDYDHATFTLIVLLLWGCGNGIIINLAGLKGIPNEMYEAASIDGASAFQRLTRITVPLMTPVIFFNIITGIIGSLQVFIQPILLTSDQLLVRPIEPLYLYAVHAVQVIMATQRYAYGMALLWVMFVVILVLSIIVFTTSRYWVHYETDQEGK
ncbi:sugar ABC transporter permease [Paenibacillus psychroresistens]|uniref:Sugar ABC transporter permease n=1 Tax=Paenibacillus psychroresistens TaxID=1778678 RepID=A0A6B8RR27_9BACL|nr:sugar ABC transporter permease [Paenibacillus psychroresistens]QGQ98162.1 sugar ABC transporter permease [Paenibacillus psychroresistens]